MLGGTLAVALIAVAAFLLTDEDNLQCVEGELQDNAVDANGRFIPRIETFSTVEEAEAFVCKHVPHPRDAGDLSLTGVEAVRDTNLGSLIEGEGRAALTFLYGPAGQEDAPPATLGVAVSFPPLGVPPLETPAEDLTIAGHDALLVRDDRDTLVFWSTSDYDFAASARLVDGFSLEDMLAVLESVR
jgi:hypothetical protein